MNRSRSPSEARYWLPVLAAAAAAVLVASLGATITDIGPWYQNLRRPSWNPPDWVFGPVWTIIFGLAALAGVNAWRDAPNGNSRGTMIGLFALNGFLNVLWSLLFFRMQRPDWALREVLLLWLSVALLIFVLSRYSRLAAGLLIPYLIWVTFAATLNLEIVKLNPL
jgi:tryptophan-rich sensory protein